MNRTLLAIALTLAASPVFAQTITTVAGNGSPGFSGDGGAATAATVQVPEVVVPLADGGYYISQKAAVRKVDKSGVISTVAGTGSLGFSGDGGPATAATLESQITSIALGPDGSLYLSDAYNNRVRRVSNGIITSVAGGGAGGDGGAAIAASLNFPTGLIFDQAGNLYIAESHGCRIRKVDTNGIISTVAGTGSCSNSADGMLAASAAINFPWGIRFDQAGHLIFTEFSGNKVRVIAADGTLATVAGTGAGSTSGDGGSATAATINGPLNIDLDSVGNLYVADFGGGYVRKINGAGMISTIAGIGGTGFSGDGGPAIAAQFFNIRAANIGYGKIFITDSENNRVRAFAADVMPQQFGTVGPATTCASEGYKGTQLTWCKNICENGLTGAVLDTWIHRWINRYRDLPYCAVDYK